MEKIKVFVYGTLKRGFGNDIFYMNNSEFLGIDHVRGKLYCNYSYPWLVGGNKWVPGEVYLMPMKDFQKVAQMEAGAGYVIKSVKTKKNNEVLAFFYPDENRLKKYFPEILTFDNKNVSLAKKILKKQSFSK